MTPEGPEHSRIWAKTRVTKRIENKYLTCKTHAPYTVNSDAMWACRQVKKEQGVERISKHIQMSPRRS